MTEFPSLVSLISWLEGFDPLTILAKHWTASGCPLCLFLKDAGAERPAVFGNGTWAPDGHIAQPGDRLKMPAWATEFCYWYDRVVPRSVTPEDCLFILRSPLFKPEASEGDGRPFIKPAILCLL